MTKRLIEPNSDRAGMSVLILLNVKTGVERAVGVMFKADRKDRGLLLNVCPWCTRPIVFDRKILSQINNLKPQRANAEKLQPASNNPEEPQQTQ